MAEQGFLFAEMQLHAGDVIDCKGKCLFFRDICSKLARLEKENTELEEQIEYMKCCENCRYYSRTYGHCYQYDSYQNCKSLSNWRLAE